MYETMNDLIGDKILFLQHEENETQQLELVMVEDIEMVSLKVD